MAVNALINKLPFEAHIPGYRFCGPGTKLAKRLVRGDRGINGLDEACRDHDIQYSKVQDVAGRHMADKELAKRALKRVFAKDSSLMEKAAAVGVAGVMGAKVKLGLGSKRKCMKKSRKTTKTGGALTFRKISDKIRKALRKTSNVEEAIQKAVRTAQRVKKVQKIISPLKARVIPIPKTGGVLPLIPIFAGLSALGALAGGTAGIVKAVNNSRAAREQLKESQRHNEKMEAIALGKGLYLKPYRTGLGLFLHNMKQQK